MRRCCPIGHSSPIPPTGGGQRHGRTRTEDAIVWVRVLAGLGLLPSNPRRRRGHRKSLLSPKPQNLTRHTDLPSHVSYLTRVQRLGYTQRSRIRTAVRRITQVYAACVQAPW